MIAYERHKNDETDIIFSVSATEQKICVVVVLVKR